MKGSALLPLQADEQKAMVHVAYLGIFNSSPQTSPAWSEAAASPVMLRITEDMPAQAWVQKDFILPAPEKITSSQSLPTDTGCCGQ